MDLARYPVWLCRTELSRTWSSTPVINQVQEEKLKNPNLIFLITFKSYFSAADSNPVALPSNSATFQNIFCLTYKKTKYIPEYSLIATNWSELVKTSTYLARIDVSDHVVNSVAVKVDNIHLALPVLLHVMGEHGVKDSGPRGKDVLVAPELPTLAGHNAVRKLALKNNQVRPPW